MFKKIRKISIFVLMFLLFTSINVFAGDIPESIMSGKQKALFIGKITDISTDTYNIVPSTVMMGNIEKPEIKIKKFDKYYGTSTKPKTGDFVVAVLLEENKIDDTWIFKSTSEDYKTLKLVSEQYAMVARYQKYINEGEYFKAQKKINDNSKVSATPTNTSVQSTQSKGNNLKIQSYITNCKFITILVIFIACIIFFTVNTLKKRRRN
ncbi:hypothetical protein [Clostridium brassicae]|uniref:Uncharacterized protein n=1 Tax=Clostridium brassicae TaxID=2999072 RepID=A0ABT4D9T0_9CLOT|nr:hypothetical protein [Clostridium brassicae]MCY6959054.1 hypothetical protein [Clostridium brassicae]